MSTSLADLSMSDLADRVARRDPTPGQAYARQRARPEKQSAREAVVSLFTKNRWPKGLSILSFPGLRWEFERTLLRVREGKSFVNGGRPRRTYITGIEQDEAVYRASLKWIPGASHLQVRDALPCGTAALRTAIIGRYHRCAFEDYALVDQPPFDAAWLDFNGPLTVARVNGIERLWSRRIRHTLIVTVGIARACREVTTAALTSGGFAGLLAEVTKGGEVSSVHTYADTTPMIQVVVQRQEALGA